jgi:hypothetical protein
MPENLKLRFIDLDRQQRQPLLQRLLLDPDPSTHQLLGSILILINS